ncbi:MAG: indolepyruvate oxidoreductase subunit beta [Clostridiales bacterium]|jgi:indolepyruvate ferredoxin oxidoreductase beta subunit|nr:indolepyruvate oxidoreductase subunit beta [Clostridiales bacterium]
MTSILIAGVGGQGTLLASRILGNVALKKGFDVKVSEVHGMSQRGGSVLTYVRFSETEVFSPIIDEGGADILLAFEELEAARAVNYLKKGGLAIVSAQRINPLPVTTGVAEYPENSLEIIRSKSAEVVSVDALGIAKEAGNVKTVNVALIGVLASSVDVGITKEEWLDTLTETIPERLLEVNLKAFELGYDHKNYKKL